MESGVVVDMNGLHRDTVLQSLPRPTVLLDTDFVMRAVNNACLTATTRTADELVDFTPVFAWQR